MFTNCLSKHRGLNVLKWEHSVYIKGSIMATHSEGIQKLLDAEREATKIVNEARDCKLTHLDYGKLF